MTPDWKAMVPVAYKALTALLGQEDRAFADGGNDIKGLAIRLVDFWKAESAGDLTGRFLDAADVNARCLCANYGIEKKGVPVTIAKQLKSLAIAGSILLSAIEEAKD